MVASRRIKIFLLFFLYEVMFSGAVRRTVRAGGDVTLSCENVIRGHQNCGSTSWLYSKTYHQSAELVSEGMINERADRLSLTANCSLVVKKVTAQDLGLYTCRQFVSNKQSGEDAAVHLSVVDLTEQKIQNDVIFYCSVSTEGQCPHNMRWLYPGSDVKIHPDVESFSGSCYATVRLSSNHFLYKSKNFFQCEVKTDESNVQLFPFSSHPSEEDTTMKPTKPTKPTTTVTETPGDDKQNSYVWLYVSVPLLVVAVTVTVTLIIVWKRTKGKKTSKSSDKSSTSNPSVPQSAPETRRDEVDSDVSYASISYTRQSNNNSKVQMDEEGDTVTYSTVKAPATDLNSLYASITK